MTEDELIQFLRSRLKIELSIKDSKALDTSRVEVKLFLLSSNGEMSEIDSSVDFVEHNNFRGDE